ncbi:MAG: glutathione peroxidase [Muribaculaceae bacterium]|nr:glutathione peroxidase [Muribaculaceae bacterium]
MANALAQTTNAYSFNVLDAKGENVSLNAYKGKVMLIVNTASRCGFTPQYEELEALYSQLKDEGFEILDFPCNQFGQQAPETDDEYVAFCQLNYKTEFKQFHKIDVNGENAIPLYTWLKSEKPFEGFDKGHQLTPILEDMFDKNMPGWRTSPDVKWNFTKFLINRNGEVVARFEPTATAADMLPAIKALLAE